MVNKMKAFDILNNLYEKCYSKNFSIENRYSLVRIVNNTIAKVLRKIIRSMVGNIDIPEEPLSAGSGVIVSITTFPKRFNYLKYTIFSLLRQSVRPEKIIINLTQPECPNGMRDLPEDLAVLAKYGVVFEFRPENLKPHGKYFYTMQEYPEKLIVTCDDDILYRKDTLKELLELHKAHPDCICSRRVRKIPFNNGCNEPYNTWSLYNNEVKGHGYLAVGVAGVLYPAKLFVGSRMFDIPEIKRLCLNADDLWLKAHEVLLGIPVVTGKFTAPDITMETSVVNALSANNVGKSANDVQWEALNTEYGINKKILNTNIAN